MEEECMKRFFAGFCVMIVVCLSFWGCNKSQEPAPGQQAAQDTRTDPEIPKLPEGPVTLSLMGGAHLVTTTEAAVKGYLKKNTNVTISFEKYSYAEYPVKMRLQFAAGESTPDVALIHDVFIPQFINAGWLMDLKGMIPFDEVLPMLDNAKRGTAYYGLTNQASGIYVFMYRQDVYDELNLKPPASWDEYYEQGLLLKEKGYYAGALNPNTPAGMFTQYMGMLGGSLFDADGKVSLSKGLEALRMIQKGYEAGIWYNDGVGGEEYWTAFNQGKLAAFPGMSFEAAYYLSNADPKGPAYGHLRLAPPMKFSSGGPATFAIETTYFAVNARSKNPEAAKHLVHWLTLSEEGCEAFANVDAEGIMATYTTAYLPGIRKVIQNGVRPWEVFGGQQVIADVAKFLVEAKPAIPYKDMRTSEAESIMTQILGETLVNKSYTLEQAIEEIRTQVSKLEN
jgi:ABC-type glycerol-3-phosphate transport system substrate-binding protein